MSKVDICVETAKVYRAGRRRFFSKRAALRAYALQRLFERSPCECEKPTWQDNYPGYNCGQHERFAAIAARFARRYGRVILREGRHGLD